MAKSADIERILKILWSAYPNYGVGYNINTPGDYVEFSSQGKLYRMANTYLVTLSPTAAAGLIAEHLKLKKHKSELEKAAEKIKFEFTPNREWQEKVWRQEYTAEFTDKRTEAEKYADDWFNRTAKNA